MKILNKIKLGALTGLAVASILAISTSTVLAGFFPADRPTFTCTTPTNCTGSDYVTFNSFTNNPVVGDERPFFAGSANGANVQDRIKVKDDQVIVLRAYVHNNADPNRIGQAAALARNVKIRVLVPSAEQKEQNLVAFVSAANANPGTINDTMSLFADRPFTVEYIPGSANFMHKANGVNLINEAVNDVIVSGSGASLGDIHGCFEFSGYVTMKVKVDMDQPPVVPPTTPPVTPPAPVKPQVTPTPSALPVTGPGDVAAIFFAVTTASSVAYYVVVRRLSLV
jgi:hypothetical protein